MKKSKVLFGVLFSTLILAGGVATVAVSKENKPVSAKAEFVMPNDVFDKIYDDGNNNVRFNDSFNRTLFCFKGVANGLTNKDIIYSSDVLNNILINGATIYNTGGLVQPWGDGLNWFTVVYPTSLLSGEGTTLEIKNGTVVGDSIICGFTLKLDSSSKWQFESHTSWAGEYVFTDPVNSTYASIYNDSFNNGTHATGYNRLMITYTGTAHGDPAAATSVLDLKKYDGYVTIDDKPFSTFFGGSTQIMGWTGQPWIQFIYPADAISEGSILRIKSGFKFGNAVLDSVAFKLNSSSKWEKIDLVSDDPLVKNNDYVLFTPSDYNLTLQNNDYPYFGENISSVFTKSFGFQFNVTIPSSNVATTTTEICFASTDSFGSSPLFKVYLNGQYKFYMMYYTKSEKLDLEWNTYNKEPKSWAGDTTHLVEFYFIKTDATHAVFILGVDNLFVWKTQALDISKFNYDGHTWFSFKNTGTTKDKNVYSDAPTVEKALSRFGVNKLKSESVPFDDNRDTEACLTDYGAAKSFYENYLTDSQKTAFVSEPAYSELRARLSAWAAANGDTFIETGLGLFSSIRNNLLFISDTDMSTLLIIITSSAMAVSIILFLIKKKKRQ